MRYFLKVKTCKNRLSNIIILALFKFKTMYKYHIIKINQGKLKTKKQKKLRIYNFK